MKYCQTCNRAYSDDSLTHCLNHGALLVVTPDSEATVVRVPGSVSPSAPLGYTNLQLPRSSHRWILVPAIFLVSFLVGASAGWLIYEFQKKRSLSSSGLSKMNTPGSNRQASGPSRNELSSISVPDAISQDDQGDLPKQDLTGTWTVVNTVGETSYKSFVNLRIGYRLVINQNGSNFTAKGEKLFENGRMLPLSGRTGIHLNGAVEGETIEAGFVEEGARRQSNGRFMWRLDQEGTLMKGKFVSTAANSSGTSVATRER
jgi:hypothetical protein